MDLKYWFRDKQIFFWTTNKEAFEFLLSRIIFHKKKKKEKEKKKEYCVPYF